MVLYGKSILDFDVNLLNGAELIQIAFGVNEVVLNFQEDISITIEDDFILWDINKREHHIEKGYLNATLMCSLLRHTILSSKLDSKGTLTIEWSNHLKLALLKISDPESYSIRTNKDIFAS